MASSNAIASGAVIVTANADGLASGLAKANTDLKAWGNMAGGNLKSTLGGALGGGGGGFWKQAGDGLKSALATVPALGGVAIGVLTAAGLAVEGFEKSLEGLAKTNKAASVLGVTASSYAGMEKVLERVGVEGDAVTTMFAKMGKNILSSGEAGKHFASMGINAKELAGQDLAEQFKTIAEGFTKIPRGAQQAAAALDIFGKSGAMLLPALQRGKEGINELIKSESFEILSDKQYKAAGDSVKAWKAAMKDIHGAWEGLSNRLAITGAPMVTTVAGLVSKGMEKMAPVLEWLTRGFDRLFTIADVTWTMLGEGISSGITAIGEFGKEVGIFTDEWPTLETTITDVYSGIVMAGTYAWDALKKGAGYVALAIGNVVEALAECMNGFKSISDVMKDLPSFMRPSSLDGFLARVDSIADRTDKVGAKIKAWGETASSTVFGASFAEWQKRMAEALKPKFPGKDALDQPAVAAMEKFEPVRFAGAIERGSKEAYSIEMRQRYGEFNKPENDVHERNGKKLDEVNRLLNALYLKTGDLAAAAEAAVAGSF